MIRQLVYTLLFGRGGEDMMAMFLATRIILDKLTFKQVPAALKPQVKEILIDNGLPELAEEE